MAEPWTVAVVMAVIFLATLIRSTFGFGEALVAVPLLAFVIPVEVAAPLAVLFSITVAGIVVAQDWRHVHVGGAWRLILATLFGIPLGLRMLLVVPESYVKASLGLLIVAFSAYSLAGRRPVELRDDRLAWGFGFAAGILGGAYGLNGPPLVLYGTLRSWSPTQFRATLQGYFLPASTIGMAGYWLAGLWHWDVTRYFLLSLPGAVIAIFLGRFLNQRLHGNRFILVVHAGLVVVGIALFVQATWP